MNARRALVASLLGCALALPAAACGKEKEDRPAPPPGYALVWADEFDDDGAPDPARWGFEQGFVRNGEMQWYQPQNAVVSKGRLVIEGRREHRPNPQFGDAAAKPEFRGRKFINFTSASLTTRGLHSWQYGRFEIRAKISAAQGLWPALWFVGTGGKWPASGEIDLMEYYDNSILANFAWGSANPGKAVWKGAKIPLAEISEDPEWDEKFHLWVMDWESSRITLSLDGGVLNQINLDKVRNAGGSQIANPFRQPHYMIINLALGGNRGGPLKDAKLPSRFEIDYVRVYQRTNP